MPDVRRESACDDLLTLPVPDAFADALIAHRRSLTMENRLTVPQVDAKFEVDAGGGSLWENVISSLNDDTRSLVGSRRGSAADEKKLDDLGFLPARANHRPSVCSLNETAFAAAGEEIELAHIDSSESPSEEASPPNLATGSPLRRSQTEIALSPTPVPPPRSPSLGFQQAVLDNRDVEDENYLNRLREAYAHVVAEDDAFDARLPRSFNLKDNRRLLSEGDSAELEPEIRCSLARFVEGSDIARMSFKKKQKKSPVEDPDVIQIQFKGSNGDLTKEWEDEPLLEDPKIVSYLILSNINDCQLFISETSYQWLSIGNG